ncbi:MAG: four helix bundle protein [Candidatus Zixiibacteriota bacterium]|nr:MAG: four helix bundle protein [candidate division Zixibacteria bacterium]
MSSIVSFMDLRIWRIGIQIVKETYRACGAFPKQETYGLASQMQRAAVSIPSNIAEGYSRLHKKEYKQFLSVSLGSCAELTTQVFIARELQYIKQDETDHLIDIIDQESKQIRSLISKIKENE